MTSDTQIEHGDDALARTPAMDATLSRWERFWDRRSAAEKIGLGAVAGFVVMATGGAVAYAIGTGGLVVASGRTVVLLGAATSLLRGRV